MEETYKESLLLSQMKGTETSEPKADQILPSEQLNKFEFSNRGRKTKNKRNLLEIIYIILKNWLPQLQELANLKSAG